MGKVVDLSKYLDQEALKQQLQPGLAGHGDDRRPEGPDQGRCVAAHERQEPGVVSEEGLSTTAGYKFPTTWDELMALQDQIADDGDTPWCIGIESGAATGWPATDWMEEIMLRTTSLENYDKWIDG